MEAIICKILGRVVARLHKSDGETMTGRVVITGANGCIGGKLARHMSAARWEIAGISGTSDEAGAKLPVIDCVGLDDAFDLRNVCSEVFPHSATVFEKRDD